MKVGYDIDGVIGINSHTKSQYKGNLVEYYQKSERSPFKFQHKEGDEVYIITGRKEKYREVTAEWLKKYNIQYNYLIMFPKKMKKNRETFREYKSTIVKENFVESYYEDDYQAALSIKNKVPECKVFHVLPNMSIKQVSIPKKKSLFL